MIIRSKQRPQGRSGRSIVETMVTLTIAAIMLAVAVSMLHSLLRIEHSGTLHATQLMTRSRLASAFRNDVNRATAVELVPATEGEGQELLLSQTDREIRYRREQDRLLRLIIEDGKVTHRDTYRLREVVVEFLPPEGESQVAGLRLLSPGMKTAEQSSETAGPVQFAIDAAVGRRQQEVATRAATGTESDPRSEEATAQGTAP